jgi:hypothetical protein
MCVSLLSCASAHQPPQSSDAGTGEVQLGVPGGADGLDFAPFQTGDSLALHTFGQGGVHVLLAVRCTGFGQRAFVSITLRNLNSGFELVAPAPARPQLLFCADDVCDLVPITVIASGLTQLDSERDGLPIEVTAEVRNAAGVSGRDTKQAVLSTADL